MTNPVNPQSPTPDENLRDARLAQALQHMPDAHMQPNPQTRQAVLQKALRAAAPPPTAVSRWWHAWVGQPGQRMPWSAALASLAIASFITVLWYGQEVPDAAPSASTAADTALARSGGVEKQITLRRKAPEPAAPATAVAEEDRRTPEPPVAAPVAAPLERKLSQSPASVAANTASPAAESRMDSAAQAKESDGAMADRAPARYAVALGAGQTTGAMASAAPPVPPASALVAAPTKAQAHANPALTISVGDIKRSVRPEQAQPLLNLLRGLPYNPTPALSKRTEPDAADADLAVEIAGQERWLIAPGQVIHLTGATPFQSDITPAQYATLRRLAMETKTQP